MTTDRTSFVLQNTRLQSLPCVPEIQLYLADEIIPLWQQMAEVTSSGDIPPPYWAFAWAGGQALARYLLDHPEESTGKRVVDFAAGSGLCGIAAVKAGAVQVLAADIDPFSATAIALNAQQNGVGLTITSRNLLECAPPEVDLILAGDICYERSLADRVLGWLQLVHNSGIRILIGDPGRDYFVHDGLMQLARYRVSTMPELESVESKQVGVFTFG